MLNNKKSWLIGGIKSALILITVSVLLLFTLIILLRILLVFLLSGPTIVIHNDSNETYQAVVAMYSYDNPSWLIKLGPGSFSNTQSIKVSPGESGFSCLYLFKNSSNVPTHAYAPPSTPNKVIEHTFLPNENVYLLSNFSDPCPLGSFLPTFKSSGPL